MNPATGTLCARWRRPAGAFLCLLTGYLLLVVVLATESRLIHDGEMFGPTVVGPCYTPGHAAQFELAGHVNAVLILLTSVGLTACAVRVLWRRWPSPNALGLLTALKALWFASDQIIANFIAEAGLLADLIWPPLVLAPLWLALLYLIARAQVAACSLPAAPAHLNGALFILPPIILALLYASGNDLLHYLVTVPLWLLASFKVVQLASGAFDGGAAARSYRGFLLAALFLEGVLLLAMWSIWGEFFGVVTCP